MPETSRTTEDKFTQVSSILDRSLELLLNE